MRKSYSITELRKRLLIVFISITFFFCLLAGRLFFLQLVQNEELVSRAADQWYRDIPLEAPRGRIYDRNGVVLADNRLVYDVYARPNAVGDRGAAAQALAGVLGYDESRVLERLNMSASEVTIARKVDEEVADRVEALGLSGVYLAAGYEREYPNGSMLSKVIGFTNIDNDGQNGLEGYYDRYLTGVDGYMYGDTDIVGREVGEGGVRYVPSVPGCDVTLTVDAEIQSFAESAAVEAQLEWGAKSCSAIVMDVDTAGSWQWRAILRTTSTISPGMTSIFSTCCPRTSRSRTCTNRVRRSRYSRPPRRSKAASLRTTVGSIAAAA